MSKRKVPAGSVSKKERYFKPSKAEYSVLGFVVVILGIISVLLEIPARASRLIHDWSARPEIVLRNELGLQTPFYVDTTLALSGLGYSFVRWDGIFEVANTGSSTVSIIDVNMDFP